MHRKILAASDIGVDPSFNNLMVRFFGAVIVYTSIGEGFQALRDAIANRPK